VTAVRFCSACGAELESAPPVTCSSCGVSHWRNPKPCANAVVVDGDRVLLARRAYPPWKDGWASPGGFCELGEHPIETVEREVLEETGLRVRVTGYLGVWVDDYADEPGDEESEVINVAYYRAVPVGGDESDFDPAEVSELRWFAWDELPAELAPPDTLPEVLAAARSSGDSPILDRNGQSWSMPENHFGEHVAERYDESSAAMFEPAAVDPAVEFLADLAGDGAALELGIGTGRIALPLARRGVRVHGIDLSEAMVARLRAKPGGEDIRVTIGDFATTRAERRFSLVYLVFNTIMNLTTQDEQVRCFHNAAAHLEPGGCFVIEVGVPQLQRLPPGETIHPFEVSPAKVGFDEYDVVTQGLI
jgi:ADP-ribose pyrophosphatase YjhB (NUDIX family)